MGNICHKKNNPEFIKDSLFKDQKLKDNSPNKLEHSPPYNFTKLDYYIFKRITSESFCSDDS